MNRHLTSIQWLPKPATSWMPKTKRSLREPWSPFEAERKKPVSIWRWFGLATLTLALTAAGPSNTRAQKSPVTATDSEAVAPASATNRPWGRIVMIGASMTAGFTITEPFGGTNTPHFRLSRYVDAAVASPHEKVRNLGTATFFLQPSAIGKRQVNQALKAQPTLLIGGDFLFWFCYGRVRTNEDRLQRFETGLKLIENISCPLLLGDIPDASAAKGGILSTNEIPPPAIIDAANRRLRAWAASRTNVVIMAVANFMRAAMANQPITVRGQTWPEGSTREFLQDDKLHPSARGCALLALAMLDTFQSRHPVPANGEIRWNIEEVFRLGFNPPPKPESGESGKINSPTPGRQ
jgi:hypothetical protein